MPAAIYLGWKTRERKILSFELELRMTALPKASSNLPD
jgi:hypothetical protein